MSWKMSSYSRIPTPHEGKIQILLPYLRGHLSSILDMNLPSGRTFEKDISRDCSPHEIDAYLVIPWHLRGLNSSHA